MRSRCQLLVALFVLAASQAAAGVSLVGQVGRLFRGDTTTQVPLGSVAILVADTDKSSQPGLVSPLGTTLAVGSTLGGSSGDLIVGIYHASDLGDGIIGVDLGGTTLTYSGALTAGTELWLMWFPTITTTDGTVGAAVAYGSYRSSVIDTASGSDIAFVAPPDGVTASLYAYTSTLGFGLASNLELSATSVTAGSGGQNAAPTDLALSGSTVNQSAGANAAIGTLTTTDADSASFTYTLVSGTGSTDNASFNLSGATLRANNPATLEPGSYAVRIQTADGSGGTFAKAFTITVTATVVVNAAPTDLALSASTVSQSAGVNATVGTLTTTDADSASFTYTLVSGAGATDNAAFNLSGATLRASNAANLAAGTYSVRIQTSDGSGGTFAKAFTITVTATVVVNAAPTDLTLSASTVNQSAGANATVGTLSTTDADSASFTYSLVSGAGATDNASFNLAGATLRANDAATLAPGSYGVRIQTSDDSGGSFAKAFTITVTARDYSGAYFGPIGTAGGHWALQVKSDGTATYIAYLPDRQSAIVVHLVVDALGRFTVAGSEIVPLETGTTAGALAAGREELPRLRAVAASFTLTGQISGTTVSGELSGLGLAFTGAADTGSSTAAGYYTAAAIGAASGTTYAIVGPGGQAVVVTTSATAVDGASGVLNAGGQLSATTAGGATLALTVSAQNQTVAATVTPAGSSSPTTFAGLADTAVSTSRAVNISTRAHGRTGDNVTIGGFVVSGTAAKRVLIRAVGPTLTSKGIAPSEVMLDPVIEVHDALKDNAVIATNDNWGANANAAEITATAAQLGATPLLASDASSAALLVSLMPGVYSFIVSGKGGTSGIVLVEIYDADAGGSGSVFANISTRARASSGNSVTIGGFVVSGNAPKRVLIRAVGPTLAGLGIAAGEVLPDPVIELHDAIHDNAIVATNDNWGDNANAADITAAGARLGATPLAGTDTQSSALLLTLQPGVYSFIASGKSDAASGIVLVEVYDAD